MPVGFLDGTFLINTAALKANATGTAAALLNQALRGWFVPAGWSGDPLDIDGMAAAFNRGGAGAIYTDALYSSNGSSGDAASAKLQSDYLAVRERAYRARHFTRVRSALMAAARRAGQGHVGAGVFARVESYAQDLLVSGASGFRPRS